ncbi:hypothetical protein DFAR_4000025 [Desulfarculales bacterium]
MDEVRKAKAKKRKLPKAIRWAVPKAADGGRRLTEKQRQALTELEKPAASPPPSPDGIFQAARARARDYRCNVFTFMIMIYFIAASLGYFIKFHS